MYLSIYLIMVSYFHNQL